MPDDKRYRMDFEIESARDDGEGHLQVVFKLDPRRYEQRNVNGERCLFDKLDKILIPESALDEGLRKSSVPVYCQPAEISDPNAYCESRIPHITSLLDGNWPVATFEDKSEEFLQSLASDHLGFAILCLDMVGSTTLANTIGTAKYSQLVSTFLYELSEVIPKFHGHVLKYTGDGFIAYFPEPSFVLKNDLAVYCALTLRMLVYGILNPMLEERGHSRIGIRVGIDSGEAYVLTIGSPETKQHKDIIGEVVNLASKIQSMATPGGVCIGQVAERSVHTDLRTLFERIEVGPNWSYKDGEGKPYSVHRITFDYEERFHEPTSNSPR